VTPNGPPLRTRRIVARLFDIGRRQRRGDISRQCDERRWHKNCQVINRSAMGSPVLSLLFWFRAAGARFQAPATGRFPVDRR
jgi:hypothetical protein